MEFRVEIPRNPCLPSFFAPPTYIDTPVVGMRGGKNNEKSVKNRNFLKISQFLNFVFK